MTVILFIMDGLGDLKSKVIDDSFGTPLELARTPHLDKLAELGQTGLMITHGKGITPESEDAHLRIFGYNPKVYLKGRGPLEALGLGIKLERGDLAFRTNLATVKSTKRGKIILIDRRAGRIRTDDAIKITKNIRRKTIDGIRFIYTPGVEHRGVLVMRPVGAKKNKLSTKITGNDPHHYDIPDLLTHPLSKDKHAVFTSQVLNKYLEFVHSMLENNSINTYRKNKGLLQANYMLVRGVGEYHKIPSMKERFGIKAVCVAGAPLYKGVAKYVGMRVINVDGATGDKNTNLKNKIRAVKKLASSHKYDLIFLHVKATDSLSHDKNCIGKLRFIEKIDRDIGPELIKLSKGNNIIITGDHATPCKKGCHTPDPIPFLIVGPEIIPDETKKFGEKWCKKGKLGVFLGKNVIKMIKNLA